MGRDFIKVWLKSMVRRWMKAPSKKRFLEHKRDWLEKEVEIPKRKIEAGKIER